MSRVRVVALLLLLFSLAAGAGWTLSKLSPNALETAREVAVARTTAVPKSVSDAALDAVSDTVAALAGKAQAPDAPNPVTDDAPNKKSTNASPIDVALIEPGGTSVIAGSAQPKSQVVISADGVEIATTVADSNGDWVLTTEHRFQSPSPKIDVATRAPDHDTGAEDQAKASDRSQKSPTTANRDGTPTRAEKKLLRPAPASIVDRLTDEFEQIVVAARVEQSEREAMAAESDARPAPAQAEVVAPTSNAESEGSPVAITPETEATGSPLPRPNTQNIDRNVERDGAPAVKTARSNVAPAIAPSPEGQETSVIPIPIGFVYREARFTDQGMKAVRLLSEYLAIKQLQSIALTGHADERGSEELNMNLSQARLDAVAREIKQRGFNGALELIAKGEDVPYAGVDRSQFSREELYALDRRVELKIAR